MKINVVLFTIIFWGVTLNLKAQTSSDDLQFKERKFDFGEIQEKDGVVSHTFVFTNISSVPININNTYSGCGCATVDYTKEPIKPGKTGKVTVTYNPTYRPGFFSKEVVVFFNNQKNYTRIWIKGVVIPFVHPVEEDHPYAFGKGLHCSLEVLSFGKIEKGKRKEIELSYANDTEKEMTLTFQEEGKNSALTYTNPGKLAPGKRGKMKFTYAGPSKGRGQLTFNVYPYINGEKLSKPLIVKVTEIRD